MKHNDTYGVALPDTTAMQFKLIDAKNALQHAAEAATPEVAKVYRQRAMEVAEIVSALARGVALGEVPGKPTILDVGFKYENCTHTPTVLVGFAPNDWGARDAFVRSMFKTSDGVPEGVGSTK
jgi:hypothetical protein